jgi:hypothetical protein
MKHIFSTICLVSGMNISGIREIAIGKKKNFELEVLSLSAT